MAGLLSRCAKANPSGTSSASTKRALVDGDSESFPLEKARADLSTSAGDVAISESGLPPAVWPTCDARHVCADHARDGQTAGCVFAGESQFLNMPVKS